MSKHERGQIATTAAQIYEDFFLPAVFGAWPKHVLRAAQVETGESVLDVGCGTGVLAREALAVVGLEGTVVGVDINEGMLAVAQEAAPGIDWKLGNAESLPFADASFDRVVSQFSLMFYANPVNAIAEMKRVLKPGGSAAIAVWGPLSATPGYAAMAVILEDLFGEEGVNSLKTPYSLGDIATLQSLFAKAGIHDADVHSVTEEIRFDSVEAWLYTEIRGWTLADVIDDASYARLQEYAAPRLAHFVGADGTVAFSAQTQIVAFGA